MFEKEKEESQVMSQDSRVPLRCRINEDLFVYGVEWSGMELFVLHLQVSTLSLLVKVIS